MTSAAVFAAVYFVLRSIPTFQMIGITGRFTTGDFLLTSIALLSGLWSGTLSILIGTIIAYAINPPIFFGLDFLPALTNVLVATLILSRRVRVAQGIYLIAMVAFVASPYSLPFGYGDIPYSWLHTLALAVLLSPISGRLTRWVTRTGFRQVAAVGLLAFVGTMTQHLVGGLLYEATAGYVGGINPAKFRQIWSVIFWLYPTERLAIVTVSTVVAVALLRSVKKWSA